MPFVKFFGTVERIDRNMHRMERHVNKPWTVFFDVR